MLIITGSGRSGTSFLAEYCRQIGYNPGGVWLPKEINAGMENPRVVAINETIVHKINNSQNIYDDTLKYNIITIPNQVVKDPRFLGCHGQVIEVWHHYRKDIKVLLLERNPSEVAKSFKLHPDHFIEQCVLDEEELAKRVAKGVQEFKDKLTQLSIEYRTIQFPGFLNEFEKVYDLLNGFGELETSVIRAKHRWNCLVDFKKVRASV